MKKTNKKLIRHFHGLHTMQEIATKSGLLDPIRALQAQKKLHFIDIQQTLYRDKKTNPAIVFLANQRASLLNFDLIKDDPIETLNKICKFIPKEAQRALASLLHLKAISFELDFELAKTLKQTQISPKNYTHVYMSANYSKLRTQQNEAIRELCEGMHYLTRIRGITFLLFIYQKIAIKLGLNQLYLAIKTGFEAFEPLTQPDELIQTLMSNESQAIHQHFLSSTLNKKQA
jgi:hypothetical protein